MPDVKLVQENRCSRQAGGEIMKRRLLFAILLIIVLAIILKYGATS
jgi:hypothetical protein